MSHIALWSAVGVSIVFALGLVSAIETRRQRKIHPPMPRVRVYEVDRPEQQFSTGAARTTVTPTTAMSMAASGGSLNGEENLAQVGGHSR